ncbi:hypothetical protein SAMN02745165_02003 [Malonomonas rubra DSM 5091]|uniref:Uncharacterized protein n=1 Tax=Malonomonas rubra DSM 5091 TaxID=1122189 RepID=A0A1M6I414_MALRU|nr:hypothetical protein [Malonomonas rubra]SHJ29203.1 hypothetical protein SAMN02745165_02003 [Malonomonas rubra DSM 5091]
MNSQDKILRSGFALFSLITSFLFVYYAVTIFTGETGSQHLKIFAYVTGGYGLMNTYILSWAWRTQVGWTMAANTVISVCFFGVFLMDMLRGGLQDSKQIAVLVGLAVVLGINWYTIRKLNQ